MPTCSLHRAAFLAATLLVAFPAAAAAQIYAWRDAAGNLVLSDRAKDPSARTYGIPAPAPTAQAPAFRTTKPASGRAARYGSLIEEHAAHHGVSADLVRAVIQAESGFNPRARSPKGAMGLMQLMPQTAAELGVTDPYEPAQNIRGGVHYLRRLLDAYDGRVELALAAYNAGPGAVRKYGGTVPPYRETRDYVAKVQHGAGTGLAGTGLAGTEPAGTPASVGTGGERTHVYRTVEIIDGREVVRYTGTPRPGAERVRAAERR